MCDSKVVAMLLGSSNKPFYLVLATLPISIVIAILPSLLLCNMLPKHWKMRIVK